jgi:CheY-like chemotaxis protein
VAILSKRGHQLVCAKNGVEAVAAHLQHPLDLVLMDIQMPEMDGYAAVWHIRKAESKTGRHIPIVAVTAHAMKGDRERCLGAGMDAYISKPFAKEELVRLVESFDVQPDELPPKPIFAELEEEEPAQFLPPGQPAPERHSVVADREQLISELGDEELVISLIDIFLEQIPKLLGDLDLAFVSGNAQAVERTAHTLKGSVGNFGAPEAFRLAEAVEDVAKGGDLPAAAEVAKQFRDEMRLVTAALSKMRG